jgi:hypothetical protein
MMPPTQAMQRLSKTSFVHGLQCARRQWWTVHEGDAPELRPGLSLQAVFDAGNRVGEVARDHVPGGVLIERDRESARGRVDAVEATRRAIEEGAAVIYEASFVHEEVYVAIDILERTERGWVIAEVKSGTGVQEIYVRDVALQTWVALGTGVEVVRSEVMHLNRECRYPDLSRLFIRADVSEEVLGLLPGIGGQLQRQREALGGPLPEVEVGSHCHQPYDCPFLERCWDPPPEHHVSEFYRLSSAKVAAFEDRGIETLFQVPEEERLTAIRERQRRAVLEGSLVVEPTLAEAISDWRAPIWFLDFETIYPPIPIWNGCRPYDQLPVQFSVHFLSEEGDQEHFDFLAEGAGDVRPALARALLDATRGEGPVLAYNVTFEQSRIRELADAVPDLSADLLRLCERTEDLLPVVRNHVYHPDFHGSFSLKKVLPALVPELSYDDLEIAGGSTAAIALQRLLFDPDLFTPAETEKLRDDLLRYCELDTLGLVRLLERLRELGG